MGRRSNRVLRNVAGKVQARSEANLQNLAVYRGQQFSVMLRHKRSVESEVAKTGKNRFGVESQRSSPAFVAFPCVQWHGSLISIPYLAHCSWRFHDFFSRPCFRNAHGGTGSLSAQSPFFDFRASSSTAPGSHPVRMGFLLQHPTRPHGTRSSAADPQAPEEVPKLNRN